MNKKFARKLKSELAFDIADAMDKKGIATYNQLYERAEILHNPRLHDVLKGNQPIKEVDLLKISKALDIPMDYFRRKMRAETKYYVDEYIPALNANELSKEKHKEYLHKYYAEVIKPKRKLNNRK